MIEAAVVFAVLGAFAYLRVKRLVERRRRLGHAELPAHMPVLAGAVAVVLVLAVVWLLPSMREQVGFLVAAPLGAGLGVAMGIHNGRLRAGQP